MRFCVTLMGGNRIGMQYDLRIAVDKKGKVKRGGNRAARKRNRALKRENLELRTELAIVKRIAVYAIDARNSQIEGTNGKSHG